MTKEQELKLSQLRAAIAPRVVKVNQHRSWGWTIQSMAADGITALRELETETRDETLDDVLDRALRKWGGIRVEKKTHSTRPDAPKFELS